MAWSLARTAACSGESAATSGGLGGRPRGLETDAAAPPGPPSAGAGVFLGRPPLSGGSEDIQCSMAVDASAAPVAGREYVREVLMLLPVAIFAGQHCCPFNFPMNSIVEQPSSNSSLCNLLG